MKKVLTIAAVFVLVLALSISAFAAPSPEAGTTATIPQDNGETVTMTGIDASQVPDKDGLEAAAEVAVGTADTLRYVAFDITYTGTINGSVTLKVNMDLTMKLRAVLHFVNNAWRSEQFDQAAGTITVDSTSPFVFVYDTAAPAPAAEAPADNAPAPVGPQRSPQTGYNTVLWIVLAAAMVSLAGYCFVSARKKTQE
ncbi:MAG: hypothetical protein IKO91_05865 [Oscillospiraceae bacterium]|nr:hypothetical protein [Oscillospiraceae bacterium]